METKRVVKKSWKQEIKSFKKELKTISADLEERSRETNIKEKRNKKLLNAGNQKANHKPTLQLIPATINRPEGEREGERER